MAQAPLEWRSNGGTYDVELLFEGLWRLRGPVSHVLRPNRTREEVGPYPRYAFCQSFPRHCGVLEVCLLECDALVGYLSTAGACVRKEEQRGEKSGRDMAQSVHVGSWVLEGQDHDVL